MAAVNPKKSGAKNNAGSFLEVGRDGYWFYGLSHVGEYVNNTGLMWQLGEKMGALLVFAEHRCEPQSHPMFNGGCPRCVSYCTTAQALEDYATIISHLREKQAQRPPAIVFGGSYGGMLAGWMRMKYPEVVDGAIAASAPIWQLSTTVTRETVDWPAVAISRGLSSAGGSSDQCLANLQVAWPLLRGLNTPSALKLLSGHLNTCKPLETVESLISWASASFFLLAEGNYPYPSSYITYAVASGSPLPAWPMREACRSLSRDFGIHVSGSRKDVNYTAKLGDLEVTVDWTYWSSNGGDLTEEQLKASGILDLATAVTKAAGVWYNVSGGQSCWNIIQAEKQPKHAGHDDPQYGKGHEAGSCSKCPPCADCPACPVSRCAGDDTPCNFTGQVPKTFAWDTIVCNDDLSQISAQGLGRDLYWPPSVSSRNFTIASMVGPHELVKASCTEQFDSMGLRGAPVTSDPWSGWMTAYYGGRNVSQHRNIVWSNGALDPWSGMGVYPVGGGPDGPMVQRINSDGSQIALVLDLGAHHLDLMFPDKRDPPCAPAAREIESQMIQQWCQEAYSKQEPLYS
ncbi:DPP7 [Symbiodinium pilosum]|uniref:DPP7 protein n=1 Tax=Symbiodinium pilosum TaxID=2952 RepID=A0A812WA85_SYMPI|nr:DPP7 [Symbiodinium pilosum]